MQRYLLKSKIHRATVTDKNLNYIGSVTLDSLLIKAANLVAYEKVQIINLNNGARFETYLMEGEEGKGEVCLNGGAARLGEVGDLVVIIAYCLLKEKEVAAFQPAIVHVDSGNRIIT